MKLSPPTRPSEPLAASGLSPQASTRPDRPKAARRRRRIGARWWFLLLVLLPTLAAGVYYAGFAANIYESEARFQVRNRASSSGTSPMDLAGGRIGAMSSALTGSARPSSEESQAVAAWIDSHAAIAALQREIDLVELWRRPEADPIARLWWEEPQLEWLLWYFRRRVQVSFDAETGVMTLRAHAFRPDDAQLLAQQVLRLSEELVNTLSARTVGDAVRVAQEDVAKAERRVIAAREALIAFREREQAFDPTRSATGAVDNIGRLESLLAQTRAELQERRAFMRADNPQVQVLANRITALGEQIATERGRMTRGSEALTQQVAGFERLELERQLADRELASTTASLEAARTDALRQQVFILRVADPQLPEWALYPRATFNTLTVFVSLSVLFGVAWLLIVSAREHAN
ncbi:MAG TPA: capsule biosynthesis protein [Falsiroseomonas sp.]|jgi:capsular polysaccharide transport system permease protein|nr:capsule biosynthesis protein [Falsiroseomonas sp.]